MLHWFLQTLGSLIAVATPILHRYGLWAIIGILFAENLGVMFAPGESVVVAAGFLAAKGVFPIWLVIPIAIIASALGGYAAYGLGGRYGHRGLVRYGGHLRITPAMVDKVHRFFQRFGAPVVVVGRFVVPLRQLQGYVAGSAKMGFGAFAVWSALGASLWVSAWGIGAWALAQQVPA